MSSIRAQLAAHGLERIADQIEAAAKPSLLLVSGEESTAPVSRLGGEPNLPEHIEWPTWRGRSLPFIAQLDLATLPEASGLPLPRSGSLYFFFEGAECASGYRMEDEGSARVLYLPTELSQNARRGVPVDVPEEMRFRSVRFECKAIELSVPDCDDQTITELDLSSDEGDRYFNFILARIESHAGPFHHLGGYPEAIQGDPKSDARQVHGGKGEAMEWELLLQVDSDENAGMMWGDVGRLYFLIRKEDLAARAFDKTWLVFQCL